MRIPHPLPKHHNATSLSPSPARRLLCMESMLPSCRAAGWINSTSLLNAATADVYMLTHRLVGQAGPSPSNPPRPTSDNIPGTVNVIVVGEPAAPAGLGPDVQST